MFLQDGHNVVVVLFCCFLFCFVFCNVDELRPSHDVTDMYVTMVFRKIQCKQR